MDRALFSRRDTNIAKGVAIIAMIIHHTYPNNPGLPLSIGYGIDWMNFVAECGKVCVSLLSILSGYGIAASYHTAKPTSFRQNIRFVFSHLIQFYSVYWFVYLIVFLWSLFTFQTIPSIYGAGESGVRFMLADLFGLAKFFHSKSFIGDWYLSSVVIFYFLSPMICCLLPKMKWSLLIIAYLPWAYYLIKGNIALPTDWFLYYLFSFIVGVYLFQAGLLNRLKIISGWKIAAQAILFCAISIIIRSYITLPADPLLAIALLFLSLCFLSKVKWISTILHKVGENSANIWLLHHFILRIVNKIQFVNYPVKILSVICICLSISISIEQLKSFTRYNDFVRYVRTRLS